MRKSTVPFSDFSGIVIGRNHHIINLRIDHCAAEFRPVNIYYRLHFVQAWMLQAQTPMPFPSINFAKQVNSVSGYRRR